MTSAASIKSTTRDVGVIPIIGQTTVAPDYSIYGAFAPGLSSTTILASNGALLIYSMQTFSDLSTLTGTAPTLIYTTVEETESDGHHTVFIGGIWVGPGGRYWGPPGVPKIEIGGWRGPTPFQIKPPCIWPFCSGQVTENGGGGGDPEGDPPDPEEKDDDDDDDEKTETEKDQTKTEEQKSEITEQDTATTPSSIYTSTMSSQISSATSNATITFGDEGYNAGTMDFASAIQASAAVQSRLSLACVPVGPLFAPTDSADLEQFADSTNPADLDQFAGSTDSVDLGEFGDATQSSLWDIVVPTGGTVIPCMQQLLGGGGDGALGALTGASAPTLNAAQISTLSNSSTGSYKKSSTISEVEKDRKDHPSPGRRASRTRYAPTGSAGSSVRSSTTSTRTTMSSKTLASTTSSIKTTTPKPPPPAFTPPPPPPPPRPSLAVLVYRGDYCGDSYAGCEHSVYVYDILPGEWVDYNPCRARSDIKYRLPDSVSSNDASDYDIIFGPFTTHNIENANYLGSNLHVGILSLPHLNVFCKLQPVNAISCADHSHDLSADDYTQIAYCEW
ncbi:hypothetical protein MMC21_005671 [Puttea exsequens]|nr:hypothetical protein [Puttea exsequens]